MKYAVVVPARNEEEYIEKTLSALKQQNLPPDQIIVVNDGSTDKTEEIARKYVDLVVNLPDKGYKAAAKPVMAAVSNAGLACINPEMDYVLMVDADHILPETYSETLIKRMQKNSNLVIASGMIKGEPAIEDSPRGSGTMIDAKFWRSLGFRYPVSYGWESWLLFKARQQGYQVKCFRDLVTVVQRPTTLKGGEGEGMYALGYVWYYALGRCFLTFLKNPKGGIKMFLGWFRHKGVERLDVAEWVSQYQKVLFWKRVKTIILHGKRK